MIFEKKCFLKSVLIFYVFSFCSSFNSLQAVGTLQSSNVTTRTPIDESLNISTGSDSVTFIENLAKSFVSLSGNTVPVTNLTKALNVFFDNSGNITNDGQQAISVLSTDLQTSLILNIKMLLYGFASDLVDDAGNIILGTSSALANRLKNTITNLTTSAGVLSDDTFAKRKTKLIASLKAYGQQMEDAAFSALITQGNIMSLSAIVGTCGESPQSQGLIGRIVLERMQEDSSELKDSKNTSINDSASPSILEDPSTSWLGSNENSINNLISMTQTNLTAFLTAPGRTTDSGDISADKIRTLCQKLRSNLLKPITFEERVAAITGISNDRSLDTLVTITSSTDNSTILASISNDTNYKKFLGICNRLINALSASASSGKSITQAVRQAARDAIDGYRINNRIPQGSDLDRIIASLSRSSISSEILQEGDIVSFQMFQPTTGKFSYLSVDQSSNDDTKIITTSEKAMGAARFLVGIYNQDNIVLEWLSDNSVSGDFDFMKSRTSSSFYYLGISNDGSITLSTKNTCFLRNGTDRTVFFSATEKNKFYFQAFGSRQKLSLKNVENNGFLTCCADGIFRTVSPGDNKPFSLLTNADGSLNQSMNSSFNAIPVLETARMLAAGRVNYFLIKYDDITLPKNKYLMTNIASAVPSGSTLISSTSESKSANDTITSALNTFSKALELATNPAELSGRALLLDELLFFLESVRNNETTYNYLRAGAITNSSGGTNDSSQKLDRIITNFGQVFATDLASDSGLKTGYNNLTSIWDAIKATPWRDKTVPANAPLDGQTVAFKYNDKFLTVLPVKDVKGKITYELFLTKTNPSNPATHFLVISKDGLFGFTSPIAGKDLYLTIKPEGSYSQSAVKQVSELYFTNLEKINSVEQPFELVSNISRQFVLNPSDKAFKISSQPSLTETRRISGSFLGIWDNSSDSVPVMIHKKNASSFSQDGFFSSTDTNVISASVVPISDFYKVLGFADLIADDAERIKAYTSVLDSITNLDDLKFWCNEVKTFILTKKDNFDNWNKFLTDSSKTKAMTDLFTKLNSVVINVKSTDSALAISSQTELKTAYDTDVTIPLTDYSQPNMFLAIKWFDANNVAHYLKANKTVSKNAVGDSQDNYDGVVPTAKSVADPDVRIKLIVEADNSVKIRFENSGFYLVVSEAGILSLTSESTEEGNKSNASSFIFEGTINALDIKLNSGDLLSSGKYLGVKSLTGKVECYPGLDTAGKTGPLKTQQIFALESLSASDIKIINARTICDLLSSKIQNLTNEALLPLLRNRIAAYSTISAEIISMKNSSLDDQKLFVDEFKLFMTQVTTLIDGRAWVEMTSDKDLSSNIDNLLVSISKFSGISDASIVSDLAMTTSLWQDGFSGKAAFANGDFVSISFKPNSSSPDKYLNVSKFTFNGNDLMQVSQADTFFAKSGQFIVSTFKNKLVFQSVSNPGQYLSGKLVSEKDKKSPPLSRMKLIPLPVSKGINGFNFMATDADSLSCIFELESDGTLQSLNIINPNSEGGNRPAKIVVDTTDMNFLKLDSSLTVESPSSVVSSFEIKKLSPLDQQLTNAYSATSVKDALAIFTTILEQNYINSSDTKEEQETVFTSAVSYLFQSYRSNNTLWTAFTIDPTSSDSLQKFLTLIDSFIKSETNKTQLIASTRGDAILDMTVYSKNDSFISISWLDPNDNVTYFVSKKDMEMIVNIGSTEKLTSLSQLHVKVPNTANKGKCHLYFDVTADSENAKKVYYLSSNQSALSLTESTFNTIPSDALLFEVYFSGSKMYFKDSNSPTDASSARFLSVSFDDNGKKSLILSAGATSISGMTMPTTLQLFEVTQVSDFDRKISVAWASSSPLNAINSYNGLIVQNMLPGNVLTLIGSVKKFVDTYTMNEEKYKLINNNSTTKTALLSLLVNLGKAVGNDSLLISKVDSIRASWSEGFTGSINNDLPIEGDVVMLEDLNNSKNILKIESVPFQGNDLYQLKSFNDDQVNSMAHFIVHTHKNMYGFESVAFPGYYLSLKETIESQNNNGTVSKVLSNPENIDPSNRLTFIQLGNNALGQPIKIGDLGSERFIFMIDESTPGSKNFNIRSRLDEINSKVILENKTKEELIKLGTVIIDNSDYSFARINRFKVDQNEIENLNIAFIPVTNLHKKLSEIKSLSVDKDILAAYYSILTNNYVINKNTTDLFGKSLKSYLSGKTESSELWKQFNSDVDSAKTIAQILGYLGKNPTLFDQINKEITSIVSKGFVEKLKDGDYVCLSWGSSKSSTWSLKIRFDSSDKKTDSAKLSSVLSSYPSSDSVFRIKFVTYQKKQYAQLIYELISADGNITDYAIVAKDTTSGSSLSRVAAGIIPAPKLTDSSITKTLFSIIPTANTVSFQAYSSNGLGSFLSIGTKDTIDTRLKLTYHDVATVTEQSKLAGTIVGKVRNPGQQELFSVKILNKVSKELIAMSTPTAGSVGDSIASLLNYPVYYQQNMQISLANAPSEDKASFIFAIDQFVQNVVGSESISATISAGVDDKSFESLINATTELGLSDEHAAIMKKDLELWNRGYSKLVSEYKLPNHGAGFLLALAGSSNNESSTNLNEKLGAYSKILYSIEGQLDGVFRLGTTNLNTVLQDFVDQKFSDDEIYEKFILSNDPFIPAAAFRSQISRETFGMQSEIAQNKNLTIDNVSFSQDKLNLNDWQKAAASFASADFNNTDSSNSALFSIIRDETNPDHFIIKNKSLGAFLSIDLSDGLTRVFKRTDSNVSLVTSSSDGSRFIFVPISDFYNQILAARNSKADAEMITNYQKAMFAIKGQQELNWMAEELIRFVAKQKVNKKTWDTFIAKKDLITKFLGLIDTFKDTFINQSFGSLVVDDRHVTMIGITVDILSGNQPVKFLTSIVVENKVLSFDQNFANLKTRLNNLTSEGINSFVTDVKNLILRKTELVLDSSIKTSNNSINALADWLELVCPINPVIKKSGQGKNFVVLSDSIRETYTYPSISDPSDSSLDITTNFNYSDLINNIAFMVDNISGFSDERTRLFITQCAKLVHPTALMIALNDGVAFSRARQIIRSAISNQLALIIDKSVPTTVIEKSIAWIPADATIENNYSSGSYGYYLELILSKLQYPLENIKGKQYTDLVSKLVNKIKEKDLSIQSTVDESTDQLYDVLISWDDSIWTGLNNYDDVKNMLPAKTVITDALFSSMKKTLVNQFINLIKSVVSLIGTSESNKSIIDKYNKFISNVTKKTGVLSSLSLSTQNTAASTSGSSEQKAPTSTSSTQNKTIAPISVIKNQNITTSPKTTVLQSISVAPEGSLQTTPD